MPFHWVDWLIIIIPLMVVAYIGFKTQAYLKSVSDFMAAGRVAGRYVVCVASGEAGMGLISLVAIFEMYYKSGFALGFWGTLSAPIGLLITLTGFAIYRYRETRAMTLAQFFEVRYSKGFRIFAGILCAFSGILNYALFPAVGARFLVYYCNMPPTITIFGWSFPTFGLIMAMALSVALMIVWFGGQITIMVTDCVQGLLSYPMYIVVCVFILLTFSWGQMSTALLDRAPGKSMLNPFDILALEDFNLWYVLIGIFGGVYNRLSWQGAQGYNCSAASPHEQKMGAILGTWRGGFAGLMIILLAVAGYTYLNHPDFAAGASVVNAKLDAIQAVENETIRTQMQVPVALAHILPIGVTGIFCALAIFLMVSTDTTYMHSWGSIVVQDVILPFRKKPFAPRQHLWMLRLSIGGVALFSFFFGLFFNQVTYILMFFALTGAIYLGGAGAVILGGLYWKRGTSAGAWGAMIVGSSLSSLAFLLTTPSTWQWVVKHILLVFFPTSQVLLSNQEKFPINGQYVYFIAMAMALIVYIGVSLLTCREVFNMDRMLHRGKYALDLKPGEKEKIKPPRSWKSLLGIDEQFTRGDKILSGSVFIYSMAMFLIWLMVVLWNVLIGKWSNQGWAEYFFYMSICLPIVIGIVSSVWFTIGGVWDLRRMFKRLAILERNVLDDGRVIGHMNADDLARLARQKPELVKSVSESIPVPPSSEELPVSPIKPVVDPSK